MLYTKEVARQYAGQWVRCESVYGVHQGMVHRVLRDGLILIHHVALTSGQAIDREDFQPGNYQSDDPEFTQVQFFLPAPGLFIPYGGLYGLSPLSPFPFII
jgi:hypothetical protein